MRRYVVLVCALALAGGCSATDNDVVAETASTSATTVFTSPTSSTSTTVVAASSTSAPESSVMTDEESLDLSDVDGWVQDWLDASFDSETDYQLVRASQIQCGDSGSVVPGDVFACTLVPQPVPGFSLESTGVVVYVLDSSGRAVWRSGDVPDRTVDLLAVYEAAPKGLYCRDLLSPGIYVPLFDSDLRAPADGFFWSLVYWTLEGQPDRMDADHNGIPCETLYDPAVVTAVLEGGPIGDHGPPPLGVALRPDGLGPVDFGTKAEGAIESLVYLLGPAETDITSHRSEVDAPPGGACHGGYACDEYIRFLSWNALGLGIVISDLWLQPGHAGPPQPLPMTFVSYGYTGGDFGIIDTPEGTRRAELLTPEGIGIGSTVTDLHAAYGDTLSFGSGCGEWVEFYVRVGDGFIAGSLAGATLNHDNGTVVEPVNPDATLRSITAGTGGSCNA